MEAMESFQGNDEEWGEYVAKDSTSGPGVSMAVMVEEVPTLTVAAIIGVTVAVLLTIAVVFLLGVLFDCRHQRLLNQKMDEVKKLRSQRRTNTAAKNDNDCIVTNMEETAESCPPAEILSTVP